MHMIFHNPPTVPCGLFDDIKPAKVAWLRNIAIASRLLHNFRITKHGRGGRVLNDIIIDASDRETPPSSTSSASGKTVTVIRVLTGSCTQWCDDI